MSRFNYKIYYDKKQEILDFLNKHKECYDALYFRYMNFMIETDNIVCYDGAIAMCLFQILSKFDVVKEEADFYKNFANLLNEHSLLDGNCCEVAAGKYPRLAEIIYPTLEQKKSKLTIYDPELAIEKIGNVKLVKEKFTQKTDISEYDTLFGMFPCEATIPLVEKAIKENKNLLVAFCDCDHPTTKYPLLWGKYWSEDLCSILKREYGDELELLQWPETVRQSTPIMLRKKK